ncbi:unnamed protein product [Vitrella brassicaformis CCMP3155]|uniref:Uncharacterized protein n=1 Tax=Vitrella brassicaformis (strain CCMP3155) TaxID=1169540 RepID=A0A0G4EZ26_VITBC|nr:unnamed protein product [Vitrella brassicaformis CCMP3155]|eukprot:CEM04448.1 unnamed protein product [Vitrella brassicaformis CCMP3155]
MLYPSLLTILEAKVDARSHRDARRNRLSSILCEDLLGLICNALFLCYPTYQLQLLPIANIILTVAVISCQLIAELTGLQHAELIDRIDQIRKGDTEWKSMGERLAHCFYPERGYQKADALVAVKTLLDIGPDPNMACGEPLHRAVMAGAATDSDRPLLWDAEAAWIFNTVELLLEAGADPNLGTRQLAGDLVVAPLDEVVIQPELNHVAVLLKANGARHSDDYYKYGGHTNHEHYAALLMRSKELIGEFDAWRQEFWKEEPQRQEEIVKELEDEEKTLRADLKDLAGAVRAETADGRIFASSVLSSQGPRRVSLQKFLEENIMLILLGVFAALTDWFSFWEMIIDEPSQYTIPLLCKRLLLASASVSTALLVLKWCLEYVQMNATLVQRKKGPSGDIELGEYSRLIDSGVDSQAATPRGPSSPAPIITRFYRPGPPRWLVRMITVLSRISVLNDSIDFINIVIILYAIGNPRSRAMGILISNLSLNLLNAIASAYKQIQQLAKAGRPEDPGLAVLGPKLGVIGALCAYWGWSWIGGFLWWASILLMLFPFMAFLYVSCMLCCATCSTRLGLLHVLIAEIVYTTSTWITFFTIAVSSERVPTWLWHLYFLCPATETCLLYPSQIATIEAKHDARRYLPAIVIRLSMLEAKVDASALLLHTVPRLSSILCEKLVGLICNALFLCYPTYQLQLLPIANIILTVAVVSCQLITVFTGLQHAELIDRINQIRKGDTGWKSMRQRLYDFFGVRGYQEGTRDAFMAVKTLLDSGANPNMANGEPLHRAVMAETETYSNSRLVWDAVAANRIFRTVELLLEAGADPNLGRHQLVGGLVVAPLDEVVIQLELKDVAVLLKANGARHSDDYYDYGGHTNQARYAALLMRSNALIRKENAQRQEPWEGESQWCRESREEIEKKLRDKEKALEADVKTLTEAVRAETADGQIS